MCVTYTRGRVEKQVSVRSIGNGALAEPNGPVVGVRKEREFMERVLI